QLATLYYVAKHPGCSLTTIAELLDLNKSAMSATAQRLERAGLVRREPDPRDGRGTRVHLTPKGEMVRGPSLPVIRRLTADITQGFGEDEVHTVLRFLNSILERYGADEQETDP